MFIIHRNGNKKSMQPIVKSKSTSFMFKKNFLETKGKKVIHWAGGGWGNRGAIQIASWQCNFSISLDIQVYYLDIKAITTRLGLLLVLYALFPSIYSFFYLTTTLLKSLHFPALKNLCSPQFSTYRYRTGFTEKRKQMCITNYAGLPINCELYLKKKK